MNSKGSDLSGLFYDGLLALLGALGVKLSPVQSLFFLSSQDLRSPKSLLFGLSPIFCQLLCQYII